ncbi:hypothetical protein HDU98_011535 [Podochytrium sp. JEL0797]|nr:hypothetical protein HDU98_011535 [Podochytrium sp. JEL0797]
MPSYEHEPSSSLLEQVKVGDALMQIPTKSSRCFKAALCVSIAVNLVAIPAVITMADISIAASKATMATSAVPSETKNASSLVARSITTDATCGSNNGGHSCLGSMWGNCCSVNGWCGSTSAYCGTGCQGAYGSCTGGPTNQPTPDATCGSSKPGGYSCANSIWGSCCSSAGWCGSSDAYCGSGCQAGFGTCGGSPTNGLGTPVIINAGGGGVENAALDCPNLRIVPGNFYAGAPPHTVGGLSVTSCGSTATITHNDRSVTVTISWNAGGSDKSQSYFELNDASLGSLLNGQSFPGQFEGTCTGTCPLPH